MVRSYPVDCAQLWNGSVPTEANERRPQRLVKREKERMVARLFRIARAQSIREHRCGTRITDYAIEVFPEGFCIRTASYAQRGPPQHSSVFSRRAAAKKNTKIGLVLVLVLVSFRVQ